MRKANIIRGRIEQHGKGLGSPDTAMVRARAREIAVTQGRRADEANEADFEQSREELMSAQNAPRDITAEDEEQSSPWEGTASVSSGRTAIVKQPADEQALPQDLVEEGLEEAAHDQMLEGNKESRRRDENLEDQLPLAGA